MLAKTSGAKAPHRIMIFAWTPRIECKRYSPLHDARALKGDKGFFEEGARNRLPVIRSLYAEEKRDSRKRVEYAKRKESTARRVRWISEAGN